MGLALVLGKGKLNTAAANKTASRSLKRELWLVFIRFS
jgi:hypothetical protein